MPTGASNISIVLWGLLVVLAGPVFSIEGDPLVELQPGRLPANLHLQGATASVLATHGLPALDVRFGTTDWPQAYFKSAEGGWDWVRYEGVAVDVLNPETTTVQVSMRIDNEGADGLNHCRTSRTAAPPGETVTLCTLFASPGRDGLWGMRGLPGIGPVGTGPTLATERIVAFQVFLSQPEEPHQLVLSNFRLFNLEDSVPRPLVDRYGQYKHAEWEGKIRTDADWKTRSEAEESVLAKWESELSASQYGGWGDGPAFNATGWFRTEKSKSGDRWSLVDPDGSPFFSFGMDCVGTWEQTFVDGREDWFEWLPKDGDPFGRLFGKVGGAHSMAEPIGGEGKTFSFYRANLIRKYGEDWAGRWLENTLRRLRAWGFNTIGNWSQHDVIDSGKMPFVVSFNVRGKVADVRGERGYWGPLKDVFDPSFAEAVETSARPLAEKYANNAMLIGFFSDNELAWETIRGGVLGSPPDQPARQAFVAELQRKYTSLDGLNEAWNSSFSSWDDVRAPGLPNKQADLDLESLVNLFAEKYFETIRTALRKHAPHHLYLGCRFSSSPTTVVRACARYADVVSFNLYEPAITLEKCEEWNDLGKPVLIGEFHFGSTDRGIFHPGLVPVRDQAARGEAYRRYIESALACPAVVGAHWFQYVDEPATGRWYDGENYNIGFVDVTDSPYPDLAGAAREVHRQAQALRDSD